MSKMIYVYRIPEKLADGFCFGGGRVIGFLNVDWFDAENPMTGEVLSEDQLRAFIEGKNYYDPAARYLVLDSRPGATFTIEPAKITEGPSK